MKFKMILSLLALLLTVNLSYASFPVVKAKKASTETITSTDAEDGDVFYSPAAKAAEKSQGLALVFFLTLGLLAGHRWYLGSPWPYNVLFIMSMGGVGIWALIDLIGIIAGTYTPARGRYKKSFF
jgi:hypothetical protein